MLRIMYLGFGLLLLAACAGPEKHLSYEDRYRMGTGGPHFTERDQEVARLRAGPTVHPLEPLCSLSDRGNPDNGCWDGRWRQ